MKSVIAVTALALTLLATGAKAQEPPVPAQAKVVVYRTNLAGARGGVNVLHSEPKVFIDDVQVGKMPRASVKRGSVLEFSVAPGTHHIYSDEKVTPLLNNKVVSLHTLRHCSSLASFFFSNLMLSLSSSSLPDKRSGVPE